MAEWLGRWAGTCSHISSIHKWCLYASARCTVYPKKYAHGFVVLCFVVVMQSFIMNSHEVFIHIHQGCFAGTGAIVRLPQCQWSKPDGYGKISQCITTTKHSKAKTVCIFLGIYCKQSSGQSFLCRIYLLLCLMRDTIQLVLIRFCRMSPGRVVRTLGTTMGGGRFLWYSEAHVRNWAPTRETIRS